MSYFFPVPLDADGFIAESDMLTWESQVVQYAQRGKPGIHHEEGLTPYGSVDCLLWRDESGALRGILNYYAQDFPPWERKGNFNMFVDPAWRRCGIATQLLAEATSRWAIDFGRQRYSRAGHATVQAFLTHVLGVQVRRDHGEPPAASA